MSHTERQFTPRDAVRTLRDWIAHLDSTDRLAVARESIPLEFTLTAVAKRRDGAKATMFPSPQGHEMAVVSGLLSQRDWIAEALGVDGTNSVSTLLSAMDCPVPCLEVSRSHAPVQCVVHDEPCLCTQLPIPTHNEFDSGPYISAGLLVTAEPRTSTQNVSVDRLQLSGRNTLGICIEADSVQRLYDEAEERQEPLAVAVVIGIDPATALAARTTVSLGTDKLQVAGALHGAPVQVVKCLTNDIRIPAHAEIVIEGHIPPNLREPEGPVGEASGYYGLATRQPVLVVDAMTHRAFAVFHTIVPAAVKQLLLSSIPREASLLSQLQKLFPNVTTLHLPLGAAGSITLS